MASPSSTHDEGVRNDSNKEGFRKFMDFCHNVLIEDSKPLEFMKLIRKRYKDCDKDFTESDVFYDHMVTSHAKMLKDRSKFFVYLKEFLNILKQNRADKSLGNGIKRCLDTDNYSDSDSDQKSKRRRLSEDHGVSSCTDDDVSRSDCEAGTRSAVRSPVTRECTSPVMRECASPVNREHASPVTSKECASPVTRECDVTNAPSEDSGEVQTSDQKSPVTRECNSPISRERASPVARECVSPVTRESDGPVSRERASPVTRECVSPVTRESDGPVSREPASPVTRECVSPVTRESDGPVSRERASPVTRECVSPVTRESDSPVSRERASPVTRECVSPVTRESDGPVSRERASPVTRECVSPVTRESDSPVSRERASPVTRECVSPVTRESDGPVSRERASPVTRECVSPVTRESDSPVSRERASPVTRECVSPVTRESDGPVSREPASPVTRESDGTNTPSEDSDHKSPDSNQHGNNLDENQEHVDDESEQENVIPCNYEVEKRNDSDSKGDNGDSSEENNSESILDDNHQHKERVQEQNEQDCDSEEQDGVENTENGEVETEMENNEKIENIETERTEDPELENSENDFSDTFQDKEEIDPNVNEEVEENVEDDRPILEETTDNKEQVDSNINSDSGENDSDSENVNKVPATSLHPEDGSESSDTGSRKSEDQEHLETRENEEVSNDADHINIDADTENKENEGNLDTSASVHILGWESGENLNSSVQIIEEPKADTSTLVEAVNDDNDSDNDYVQENPLESSDNNLVDKEHDFDKQDSDHDNQSSEPVKSAKVESESKIKISDWITKARSKFKTMKDDSDSSVDSRQQSSFPKFDDQTNTGKRKHYSSSSSDEEDIRHRKEVKHKREKGQKKYRITVGKGKKKSNHSESPHKSPKYNESKRSSPKDKHSPSKSEKKKISPKKRSPKSSFCKSPILLVTDSESDVDKPPVFTPLDKNFCDEKRQLFGIKSKVKVKIAKIQLDPGELIKEKESELCSDEENNEGNNSDQLNKDVDEINEQKDLFDDEINDIKENSKTEEKQVKKRISLVTEVLFDKNKSEDRLPELKLHADKGDVKEEKNGEPTKVKKEKKYSHNKSGDSSDQEDRHEEEKRKKENRNKKHSSKSNTDDDVQPGTSNEGERVNPKIVKGSTKQVRKLEKLLEPGTRNEGEKVNPKIVKGSTKQVRKLEKLLEVPGKWPYVNPSFDDVQPGTSNEGERVNPKIVKGSTKQVRKLEKLLEQIRDKIEHVRTRELDLDDLNSNVSDYILEDRLQQKFVKVWKKLCDLHNSASSTGRPTEKYFKYEGTRYPDVNRKIEKFINRKKVFPDYHDVRNIIVKVNKDKKLHLRPKLIDDLAREAFTDVGNKLQQRRKKDFRQNIDTQDVNLTSVYDDPALYDTHLKKKLDSNKKAAKTSIERVVEKYARLQYDENYQEEEDEEEEEEEEEVEEEDEDLPDIKVTTKEIDQDVIELLDEDLEDSDEEKKTKQKEEIDTKFSLPITQVKKEIQPEQPQTFTDGKSKYFGEMFGLQNNQPKPQEQGKAKEVIKEKTEPAKAPTKTPQQSSSSTTSSTPKQGPNKTPIDAAAVRKQVTDILTKEFSENVIEINSDEEENSNPTSTVKPSSHKPSQTNTTNKPPPSKKPMQTNTNKPISTSKDPNSSKGSSGGQSKKDHQSTKSTAGHQSTKSSAGHKGSGDDVIVIDLDEDEVECLDGNVGIESEYHQQGEYNYRIHDNNHPADSNQQGDYYDDYGNYNQQQYYDQSYYDDQYYNDQYYRNDFKSESKKGKNENQKKSKKTSGWKTETLSLSLKISAPRHISVKDHLGMNNSNISGSRGFKQQNYAQNTSRPQHNPPRIQQNSTVRKGNPDKIKISNLKNNSGSENVTKIDLTSSTDCIEIDIDETEENNQDPKVGNADSSTEVSATSNQVESDTDAVVISTGDSPKSSENVQNEELDDEKLTTEEIHDVSDNVEQDSVNDQDNIEEVEANDGSSCPNDKVVTANEMSTPDDDATDVYENNETVSEEKENEAESQTLDEETEATNPDESSRDDKVDADAEEGDESELEEGEILYPEDEDEFSENEDNENVDDESKERDGIEDEGEHANNGDLMSTAAENVNPEDAIGEEYNENNDEEFEYEQGEEPDEIEQNYDSVEATENDADAAGESIEENSNSADCFVAIPLKLYDNSEQEHAEDDYNNEYDGNEYDMYENDGFHECDGQAEGGVDTTNQEYNDEHERNDFVEEGGISENVNDQTDIQDSNQVAEDEDNIDEMSDDVEDTDGSQQCLSKVSLEDVADTDNVNQYESVPDIFEDEDEEDHDNITNPNDNFVDSFEDNGDENAKGDLGSNYIVEAITCNQVDNENFTGDLANEDQDSTSKIVDHVDGCSHGFTNEDKNSQDFESLSLGAHISHCQTSESGFKETKSAVNNQSEIGEDLVKVETDKHVNDTESSPVESCVDTSQSSLQIVQVVSGSEINNLQTDDLLTSENMFDNNLDPFEDQSEDETDCPENKDDILTASIDKAMSILSDNIEDDRTSSESLRNQVYLNETISEQTSSVKPISEVPEDNVVSSETIRDKLGIDDTITDQVDSVEPIKEQVVSGEAINNQVVSNSVEEDATVSSSSVGHSTVIKLKQKEVRDKLLKLKNAAKRISIKDIEKPSNLVSSGVSQSSSLLQVEDKYLDLIENYQEPDSYLFKKEDSVVSSSMEAEPVELSDSE